MSTYRIFDQNRASNKFSTQFEDFHRFLAADWLITRVGTTPTEALQNSVGGRLLLTMAATDDSLDGLQFKGSDAAVRTEWAYTTGKKLQFTSKLQISDAVQSDFIVGLHSVSTDPIGTPPTNGIFFRKDDATANLWFVARKAGVETKIDTGILVVAATDVEMEFYHDGSHSTIAAFVNGAKVGSLPVSALPASGTALALSFAMQNGEAVAKTMNIDYIGAQVER